MEKTIVIATHNPGKAKEFKEMFQALGYTIKTLKDFPEIGEIPETGTTFLENAQIKARTVAEALSGAVLADDSGLCVDVLDGAPGVYSARYAGEPADDEKNKAKLLKELTGVPKKQRTAHFMCTLVLMKPGETPVNVTGKLSGMILQAPRGTSGFGYDPLFYVPRLDKSLAELSPEKKNEISHRGHAIAKLRQNLPDWLTKKD